MTRIHLHLILVTIDGILAMTAILAAALVEPASATQALAGFVGLSTYLAILAILDDQTRMQNE